MKPTTLNLKTLCIPILLVFGIDRIQAQECFPSRIPDTIKLINPSFEGKPARGGYDRWTLNGWRDYGSILFSGETPADVHPDNFWSNNKKASHGKTYIGLVARKNGSYEAISQKLKKSLKKDVRYTFSIDICVPDTLLSPAANFENYENYNRNMDIFNFSNPSLLLIEGLTKKGRRTQLAISDLIDHTDWKNYTFILKPDAEIETLILSIDYATKTPIYCALLIDNLSDIVELTED